MKKLLPEDFVSLNELCSQYPIRVQLAYGSPDNILFGEAIYRSGAKLWLLKDLADVVLKASIDIIENYEYKMVLYDGLRTTDAQAKMGATERAKANPQWFEAPRLLSPPGRGAHPRGMAIDLTLETASGEPIDMGTPFDLIAGISTDPETNAAHRHHPYISDEVKANRKILEDAMLRSAKDLGIELIGLPQEWWDFRFPPEVYNQYEALSDNDLPAEMKMTDSSYSSFTPSRPSE